MNKWGIIFSAILLLASLTSGPFAILVNAEAQPPGWVKYTDPKGRFTFSYPSSFGEPSRGTNDGFGNRAAALKFSNFSAGMHNGEIILGGEAALTKGRITIDIQAAGGLYDSISMEIFPDPLRKKIIKNLPALKASNLCRILGKKEHLDLRKKDFRSLSQKLKEGIINIDRMRNYGTEMVRCKASGNKVSRNTVSFHKKAKFQQGSHKQHIYGAVRFVRSPYSSFQLVRAGNDPPDRKMIEIMTRVVNSIRIIK